MPLLIFLLTSLLPLLPVFSVTSSFLPDISSNRVVISNRVLAKINQKTITVIDLQQKMDLFISKRYAQQELSPLARSHFYLSHWREFLSQEIDHYLILCDAEQLKILVSDKEVRERMLEHFGPNMMTALDKIGITYEKAKEMIHSELAVEKMTSYRVHAKAFRSVHPQQIKANYKLYCEQNPPKETWGYRVLSIRSSENDLAQNLAEKAHQLLSSNQSSFADLSEKLFQDDPSLQEKISLTASDLYELQDRDLSAQVKTILQTLSPGSYSTPQNQVSRFDNSQVSRIYFLQTHTTSSLPSFEEMEHNLREQILEEAIHKETSLYINKLRLRYGFSEQLLSEWIPEDFQPFSIQ